MKINIPEDTVHYRFNGVLYHVIPRFQKEGDDTLRHRFGRMIVNCCPAHLTNTLNDDTIKAEYVLDTAGKEDYADQNKTK